MHISWGPYDLQEHIPRILLIYLFQQIKTSLEYIFAALILRSSQCGYIDVKNLCHSNFYVEMDILLFRNSFSKSAFFPKM